MNKISLAINVILVAAVGVLFYLYSSLKKDLAGKTPGDSSEKTVLQTPATLQVNSGDLKDAKIAYINIDSLNYNYDFITDNTKEMRAREAALQNQYTALVTKFQTDYQELEQAAQAGIRPQAELEKEKARLEQMQYEIAAKEKQMQGLQEDVARKQGDMMRKVSMFIDKFNNGRYDYILAYTSNISSVLYAKPGLDLTKEVLAGLNAEYKASKGKK